MTMLIRKEGDFKDYPPLSDTTLIICDPVYGDTKMMNTILNFDLPTLMFMYADDIYDLTIRPSQILFWVKPESTKNTSKRYSRFVEVICTFNVHMNKDLHWSNRTGVFTDRLFDNKLHPWKKPESLIKRLIKNHYTGEGIIYDPCAGSFTVENVCRELGIDCYSVEIDAREFGM